LLPNDITVSNTISSNSPKDTRFMEVGDHLIYFC
jgi:hypothetical protein